ncbi:MAG: hypothetical protein EOO48_00265 [Flavobacterium sp.]|nr:MAG: hypothetical protein EOO48_00265 [Flavobacterium sp.]
MQGFTLTVKDFSFPEEELVKFNVWLPRSSRPFIYPEKPMAVEISRYNRTDGHINAFVIPVYPSDHSEIEMPDNSSEVESFEIDLGDLNTNRYRFGAEHSHYQRLEDECLIIMLHECPVTAESIKQIFDRLYEFRDTAAQSNGRSFVIKLNDMKSGFLGSPKKAGISIVSK